MNISRIHASAQLTTSASPTRPESSNTINLGAVSSSNNFNKDLYASYVRNIRIYSTGCSAFIAFEGAECTESATYVPAIPQSDGAVAIGTVTTDGTILIAVTAAVLSDYPSNTRTVTITTDSLPSASVWATQAREALAADSVISRFFTVGGFSDEINLIHKINDYGMALDSTMNIAITAGTAVGITNAPTSSLLVSPAYAEGILFDQYDQEDAEGIPLPTMNTISAAHQFKCIRGIGTYTDNGGGFKGTLQAGNFCINSNNDTENDCGMNTYVEFEAVSLPFEVTCLIVTKKA